MITFGILGLIIISLSVWIKKEKKQNLLFILGGIFLLIYSYYIGNIVFVILQIIFILSALIELIKISKSNK